jgi:hypothetical protein
MVQFIVKLYNIWSGSRSRVISWERQDPIKIQFAVFRKDISSYISFERVLWNIHLSFKWLLIWLWSWISIHLGVRAQERIERTTLWYFLVCYQGEKSCRIMNALHIYRSYQPLIKTRLLLCVKVIPFRRSLRVNWNVADISTTR